MSLCVRHLSTLLQFLPTCCVAFPTRPKMSENCLGEDAAGVEIENEITPAVPRSVDAFPSSYPLLSRLSGAAPATTGSACHDLKRLSFFL